VRRVRAHYRGRGRGVHVLDLTTDIGIPVAIALSWKEDDGKSIVLGLGAHLDAGIAVNRALAEMNQMLVLETEAAKSRDGRKAASSDDTMLDWIENKSLTTEPYCVPDGDVRLDAYVRPEITDLKQAVERCMRAVSDKGLDMIVLDHSRPEIDFATARVVVPGNEPEDHEEFLVASNLTRQQLRQSYASADSVPFWSLPAHIDRTEMAGLDATRYRQQFNTLMARPFLFAAMVLIAAAVSLRFFRFGGVARMVLAGVASGFLLYIATKLIEDLGAAGILSTVAAAWSPSIIGGLLGSLALLYQEDG